MRRWHAVAQVLVLACTAACSTTSVSLARAEVLDPDFGNGGRALVSFPGADSLELTDIELDGSGGSVSVGGTNPNSDWDFAVVRLDAQGSPNHTFGAEGRVLLELGATDVAQSLAVQSDQKVVVAGYSAADQQSAIGVARLNPDGSPDPSFDGDGLLHTKLGYGYAQAVDVVVQPDRRIVVLAGVGQSFTDTSVLLRLTPDGQLDSSFGTNGIAGVPFHGTALALSNGKIVVAGNDTYWTPSTFEVARFDSIGSPDPSFDSDGFATTPVATDAQDVFVHDDGTIVVGGGGFALVSYRSDGSLNPAFGNGGIATSPSPQADGAVLALARRPSSGYVAAAGGTAICIGSPGSTSPCSFSSSLSAAGFSESGGLDPSFGSGGLFSASAQQDGTFELSRAIATDGEGFLLAGEAPPYMAVLRVLPELPQPKPQPQNRRRGKCGGFSATAHGTPGGDRLVGTARRDVLIGGRGSDVIRGLGGADVICGGPGPDRLLGGTGRDKLLGGPSLDVLLGGRGRSLLYGGSGKDRCGGRPAQTLYRSCERGTRLTQR